MQDLEEDARRDLKRKIHETIASVSRDIAEEKQFNTAVARLMELLNALTSYSPRDSVDWTLLREGTEILLACLYPFCPHICEELWEALGNDQILANVSWPKVDPTALVRDTVTMVIQINGKVRERMILPAGLTKEETLEQVFKNEGVKKRISNREIVKTIIVPDRLVNLVVKG